MAVLLRLMTQKLNPLHHFDLTELVQRSNLYLGLTYGSISFFLSILHNIFVLYHVDTFVTIYKIDKTSFWIGETIFLVWNCVNDPLFGWFSDGGYLKKKRDRRRRSSSSSSSSSNRPLSGLRRRRSSEDVTRTFSSTTNSASSSTSPPADACFPEGFDEEVVLSRVRALSWSGPGLAIAFALLWSEWSRPSLQFAFCLCLYDGFLTLVDLHHSALLADLEVAHAERTKLNSWCSLFSALGSVSVFTSYLFWSRDHISSFRLFCHALAFISILGFSFSCFVFRRLIRLKSVERSLQKQEQQKHQHQQQPQKQQRQKHQRQQHSSPPQTPSHDHPTIDPFDNNDDDVVVGIKTSKKESLSKSADDSMDSPIQRFLSGLLPWQNIPFFSSSSFPTTTATTSSSSSSGVSSSSSSSFRTFLRQLLRQRNFLWFSAMNVLQCFHCHFNSNFFPLFVDSLLQDRLSPRSCSILLGFSFVIPHLNNLYFLSLCRRFGTYVVIRKLFLIKVALGLCMLVFSGPDHTWMLCAYLACNRVFTEGTCKLLTLVITDLVDEDVVLNDRRRGVSALIFGTAAFLSKPGQTLAPLLGTLLIAAETGKEVFAGEGEFRDKAAQETLSVSDRSGIFRLLIYLPVFVAVVQLLCWSRFSLHGSRLKEVKRRRKEGAGAKPVDCLV